MKSPKISIITPTYNSEKTVERTIQSVIGQNYPYIEYIIIDGASTDHTLDILKKYSDNIDFLLSEKDKGISEAFNKGIAHATGDIIGIINSDDYLLPGAIQAIAEQADDSTDIYQGNILLENNCTHFQCREVPSRHFPVMPFFCHVAHQGMYVTREAYKRLGTYDTRVRWPMDLEFLMRADRMGARMKHINQDIAVFCTGGFTSSNITQKKQDYLYIVRKNGGSTLQAYTFYYYLYWTQQMKKVLRLFGKDFSQKMRYGNKT